MLPIIQKWISKTDEREIKYFLILWFAILLLNYFNTHIMILSYVNLFTGYLGYFILGYYLNKKDNKYTNSFLLGVFLYILGTLMVLFSILIPTWMTGQVNLEFVGYLHLAPSSVFKAIGMFLILKNINYNKLFGSKTETINNFMLKFADITFGLYLIHVLFPFEKILNMHRSPFINIPLGLIIIIIVTYIILNIMNKIPVLQRFTGMKY